MNTKSLVKTAVAAILAIVLFAAQALAQGNYTNNGNYTNSGTATFKNYTNGTAGVTANTGTMKIKAVLTQSNADATKFDTNTGSVEYIGINTAQTIIANINLATYGNLAARNGGAKTLTGGNIIVTGTVTSDQTSGAGNILDIGANTLTVSNTASAPIVSVATGSFTFTSGTVVYSGTSNQTIFPATYGTLTLSSVSGTPTKAVSGNLTVNSALNVNASNTLDVQGPSNTFTLGGSATYSNLGSTRVEGNASFTAGITIGGSFEYYGTGQTIGAANYTDLALSGISGVKLFGGNVSVAGNYTLTGANTRNYNGKTFTYDGSSSTQTVAADNYTTSADLIFSGSAAKTFAAGTASAFVVNINSASGAVTIPSGATVDVGNTGTLIGSVTIASVNGLVNQGTLNLSAPAAGPTFGALTISGANSVLTNQSGAQLTLTNADFVNGGIMTNAGTITIQ